MRTDFTPPTLQDLRDHLQDMYANTAHPEHRRMYAQLLRSAEQCRGRDTAVAALTQLTVHVQSYHFATFNSFTAAHVRQYLQRFNRRPPTRARALPRQAAFAS